jgi:hypothetical protein
MGESVEGFSRRGGPNCVGRMENGWMKLAWERLDLVGKDKANKLAGVEGGWGGRKVLRR